MTDQPYDPRIFNGPPLVHLAYAGDRAAICGINPEARSFGETRTTDPGRDHLPRLRREARGRKRHDHERTT